jgi:hypothetical protein
MHVKFMRKLYSLLMHIKMLFDVIFQHIEMLFDVIIMFCIDLWGFSIDPLYFGYNSA